MRDCHLTEVMLPSFAAGVTLAALLVTAGSVPQRLRPQCRSNVCDDRPECPRGVSCHCLFASRVDCSVYYQCVSGKPHQHKCSPGLLFNADTLSCDYSHNVNCSFASTTTISTESTTKEGKTEISTTERAIKSSTIPSTKLLTSPQTTEESVITETTSERVITETTKMSTTKMPVQSTTKQTTEGPTTEESTSKITQGPTTETTEKSTTTGTTETTEKSTTTGTTETTEKSTTTGTTEATEKSTTTGTTETTKNPTITEPTKKSTTEAPSTTQPAKKPTTTEIPEESTTSGTMKESTTTEGSEVITTTQNILPITSETTTKPVTTETTKETSTDETTKSPSTIRPNEPSASDNLTTKVPTTAVSAEVTATMSTTTSGPSSEFLCAARFGLFSDPKSCFRFYHCSHWIPYHKWCPSGLHFNPRLKVCDWPYRAGCDVRLPTAEPVSPTTRNPNDALGACDCDCCELPDPADCQAYVLCVDGVAFGMRCSEGLRFNPMTATCDFRENVVCGEDFECPESSGRYLLPESCSYFVECRRRKKTLRKCPEGLQFDQSSGMCGWTGSCPSHPPESDSHPRTTANDTMCDGCDYCFKPVGVDCTRYARCVRNTATVERCSDGLFFDPESELCDHRYNVECPETDPAARCPEPYGYFPHPGDCGLYLKCVNGSVSVQDCPGILHFDPSKRRCDYPWVAGCRASDDPVPTLNPGPDVTECDCECCLKPSGTDCTSFVLCVNEVGFVGSCSSGLRFNPQTENCDFSENVECPVTPEIPGISCPDHQGLFPHPEDCRKFVHCAHGFPHVKDCPASLHFNPKLKVCDWPHAAGCQDPSATDAPTSDGDDVSCDLCDSCFIPDRTDCSSFVYCRNGRGHRLRCSENLRFNPEIEACDWAGHVACPDPPASRCARPDGLFPDGEDCRRFIHCSSGVAYRKDCPDGLRFHPRRLVCDWPENVRCGETPAEPTPQEPDAEASNVTCPCDCCFLPVRDDCSRYVLCLDGRAHAGQCSGGLLFSPRLQNCDVAERVTCDEGSPSCPQPNGLFPDDGRCSSYVKCSGGVSEVEYCPTGTHFSADGEQCVDPCEAKCDASQDCSTGAGNSTPTPEPFVCSSPNGLYPDVKNCSSYFVCSRGRPQRLPCPHGLHYSARYEVCEDPCDAQCDGSLECTTDPKPMTTLSPRCVAGEGLYPIPGDCSAFYLCSDGEEYLIPCPPGLHFSREHEICEDPCVALCNATLNCETSTKLPPAPVSPVCEDADGLFPNPDDCGSFYQCSGGRSHRMRCPVGLHFSAADAACERPCDAGCNKSIDCSTTLKPAPTPAPHCAGADGLFPAPDDCSSFYLCSGGKDYRIACPPGLHFSERHERCENPCLALCNASLSCEGTTVPSSTSRPPSPECSEPDGLFPNPDDCGSFYQCSDGRAHVMHCPRGLHFSEDDAACERPCVAGCDVDRACPPEYPDPRGNCSCDGCYLPDPSDCSAFYFCEGGRLAKGYCPYGTLFGRTAGACEDERTAACEANGDPSLCPQPFGSFPHPGDCRRFVRCDGGVAHVRQCPAHLEYDPDSGGCTPPKGRCGDIILDPNCPEATGVFPDPTHCASFYQCERGVAHRKRCPPPLLFNPDPQVCDWPENVACGPSTTAGRTTPAAVTRYTSPGPSTSRPSPSVTTCHEVPGVVCPCACRVPTYDECGSYLQCREDGTACKRFCPEGLYFNKVEMVCDLPENVECRDFFFSSLRRAKLLRHRSSRFNR